MKPSKWIVVPVLVCGCSAHPSTTTTTTYEYTPTTSEVPEPTLVTSTTGVESSSTFEGSTDATGTQTTTGGPGTSGEIPDFGDGELGCNGKIDFLFVIDREFGMDEYWSRFWASFPGFIEDVLATFKNFDMHFMVVDGYGSYEGDVSGWGMPGCEEQCAENNGSCSPVGPADFPCDGYVQGAHETCGMRGAGIVFPAGFEAANHECGVVGGRRYVVGSEQPNLADTVKCISQQGYGNANARAAPAMLSSILPEQPPSQCNAGFLRDDALLVIVYYTNYHEGGLDYGPPKQWAESLYTLKQGDEDKVAVIGIIWDYYSEGSLCGPGSGSYADFSSQFLHFHVKHKVEGSLCASSYTAYLEEGLELIGELCDAEVPT